MTNTITIFSNSLIFNDSWLAHIGSRIYRIAIETIEFLGTAFSHSLVQSYSGKQLYQLVDAYREGIINRENYNQARLNYATGILTALQGEENIFEKTKNARTILNTHIMGLSILQDKDKRALSEHVAYTLLPSLINAFGEKIASKSVLALCKLDDITISKGLNEYVKLYRDITLQQNELDSFVEALQQLNSNVSKDILIHELLLSRNRNLTGKVKDTIASTLKNKQYIDIKLQKKMQLIDRLQSQNKGKKFSESEITLELQSHRDAQVEALCYAGRSMFFDTSEPIIDESGDIFYDCAYAEATEATTGSTFPEIPTQPVRQPLSSEMPVGISNTNQNCWYNSALQILHNTPIYRDISRKSDKFSKDLPKISESIDLYRNTYWHNSDMLTLSHPSQYGMKPEFIKNLLKEHPHITPAVQAYSEKGADSLNLHNQMQGIRTEIHNKVDPEFKSSGAGQEDSKQFLYRLLDKLSIDTARIPVIEADLFTLNNRHLLLEKAPLYKVDLETLFTGTEYRPYGIIFHTGSDNSGHYFAAVKLQNSWYLCNDARVERISEEKLQSELYKNSALIIASHINKDDPTNQAPEPRKFLQSLQSFLTRT